MSMSMSAEDTSAEVSIFIPYVNECITLEILQSLFEQANYGSIRSIYLKPKREAIHGEQQGYVFLTWHNTALQDQVRMAVKGQQSTVTRAPRMYYTDQDYVVLHETALHTSHNCHYLMLLRNMLFTEEQLRVPTPTPSSVKRIQVQLPLSIVDPHKTFAMVVKTDVLEKGGEEEGEGEGEGEGEDLLTCLQTENRMLRERLEHVEQHLEHVEQQFQQAKYLLEHIGLHVGQWLYGTYKGGCHGGGDEVVYEYGGDADDVML